MKPFSFNKLKWHLNPNNEINFSDIFGFVRNLKNFFLNKVGIICDYLILLILKDFLPYMIHLTITSKIY